MARLQCESAIGHLTLLAVRPVCYTGGHVAIQDLVVCDLSRGRFLA